MVTGCCEKIAPSRDTGAARSSAGIALLLPIHTENESTAYMTHENQKLDDIDVAERIQHILDEIRIILPGTEVLFGFLLVAVFSEGFDSLKPLLKYMHLASLGSIAITTILLIAPSAYDRIAEQRENIQGFYRFTTQIVLLALIFLALGLSGIVFVVVFRAINSYSIAGLFSGAVLISVTLFGLDIRYLEKAEGITDS
jgi:hypothetical protein